MYACVQVNGYFDFTCTYCSVRFPQIRLRHSLTAAAAFAGWQTRQRRHRSAIKLILRHCRDFHWDKDFPSKALMTSYRIPSPADVMSAHIISKTPFSFKKKKIADINFWYDVKLLACTGYLHACSCRVKELLIVVISTVTVLVCLNVQKNVPSYIIDCCFVYDDELVTHTTCFCSLVKQTTSGTGTKTKSNPAMSHSLKSINVWVITKCSGWINVSDHKVVVATLWRRR